MIESTHSVLRPFRQGGEMPSSGSITRLFNRLQQGERATAQEVWQLYFRRLVGLARKKLGDLPRRAADEEDVALSAFDSLCRGAEQGRFKLADHDELWQILVLITARKASDLRQYECRDKRDWRRVHHEAQRSSEDSCWAASVLQAVLSREPDPAFAAEMAEECLCTRRQALPGHRRFKGLQGPHLEHRDGRGGARPARMAVGGVHSGRQASFGRAG
jgi:hypothetical protein